MLIINDSPTAHTSTLKTAFNLINFTFLGSGILSIPYAFRLSGIFPGVSLLIIFALASFYAALIIKTIMDKHSISSFIEIGKRSFGAGGSLFTQFVFFLDLFFTACSYLVLISDSFVALYPDYNKDLVCILVPSTWFKSLSVFTYASTLGVVAIIVLMGVVLGCGFSTPISPGSLLSPSIVTSFPDSLFAFPMSFGLLYEGFGCHTMIPQIINEMKKPKQFNTMVGLCFLFACILNIGFGIVGYLMFGNNTMEEISLNLIHFGDYNPYLIKSTLWLIIISFVTKFPLVLVPLNLDFEQTIFHRFPKLNNIYISIFMRTVLAFLILVVTIVAPNFDSLIGILGSIISITVCVLIPVICHLKLNGGWRVPFYRLKKLSEFKPNQDSKKADQVVQVVEFNVMGDWEILMCWMILLLGTFFAIMGTVWACIQPKLHVHTFE